jgi:ATP-binding cassette subfamily C protein
VTRNPRLAWPVVGAILRARRRDAAWLAVWSAAEALPVVVFGRAVAGSVDAFRAGGIATGLAWLGALLAAAAAGAAAGARSYRRLAAIVEPLRDGLVRTVVTAALSRAVRDGADPGTGAVARITHQAEIVRDSFAGLVTTARSAAFTAAAAVGGLLALTPLIAAWVVPPLLVSLGLFAWLMRGLARRQRECIASEEAVSAEVSTVTASLRDVTACGAEDRAARELGGLIATQARAARALAGVAACRTLVLGAGCWVPVLMVAGGAPWLLRHGATPGQVIGALAYLASGLQAALHTLVQGAGSSGIRMTVTLERVVSGAAADSGLPAAELARRLRPAVAAAGRHAAGRRGRPARSQPTRPGSSRQPGRVGCPGRPPAGQGLPGGGALQVRGLTFAYGPAAEPVIAGLDLDLPSGGHLAVVGPSGIGKSTLAGLIAGLLRPARGQVLLDGADVAALDPAALACRRVLLPQEAYVFSGTIRENLTYLNPRAGTADLERAARAVGAASLVARAGGYDAPLRPADLSAGERQLVALARAYLSPAGLVILDEATCHLDPAAEARAEQAFTARPGTLIVIAHRVSSARRAQRILVLDGSRAQLGDHASLLASSPLYAELAGGHQELVAAAPQPA